VVNLHMSPAISTHDQGVGAATRWGNRPCSERYRCHCLTIQKTLENVQRRREYLPRVAHQLIAWFDMMTHILLFFCCRQLLYMSTPHFQEHPVLLEMCSSYSNSPPILYFGTPVLL
jgi:hypothetical protein